MNDIKTTTMQKRILFKSTNKIRLNDVFDPKEPYEFQRVEHQFVLMPNCNYWRFGLIFTNESTIPDPSAPDFERYVFTKNQYLQVNVGIIKSQTENSNPEFLQITDMQQPPFYEVGDYIPFSPVTFSIKPSDISNRISYSCTTVTNGVPGTRNGHLDLSFNKFFYLAVWSDYNEFELECDLTIFDAGERSKREKVLESTDANEMIIRTGGNVDFRYGNVLDTYSLKYSDLFVLPTCSSGKIDPLTDDIIRKNNVSIPASNYLGGFFSVNAEDLKKGAFVGWAYSVDYNGTSNYESITRICQAIIARFSGVVNTVTLPLLGTSSGGLDLIEVASIYLSVFSQAPSNMRFVVAVNSKAKFDFINHDRESIIVRREDNNSSDNYFVKDEVDPTLGVIMLAEEIAKLTNRIPTKHGTVIGVFGRWGRGKTYLMNKLWDYIKGSREIKLCHRVDFHAWKYQDTSAIWGYLYEQFANEYFQTRKNKLWSRVKLNLKRKGSRRPILFLIGFLISTGLAFVPFGTKWQFLNFVFSILSVGQVISLLIVFFRYSPSAKGLYHTYFTRHNFSKLLGIQAEVQKELQVLLDVWAKDLKGERIALFVDDIDRCPETIIIQTVDALRVMVEDHAIAKHIVVVVSMDERILRLAVKFKYQALMYSENGKTENDETERTKKHAQLEDLVNEYFDKLFIVGIKLGELDSDERKAFFKELVKDNLQKNSANASSIVLDRPIVPQAAVSTQTNGINNELVVTPISDKTTKVAQLEEVPDGKKDVVDYVLSQREAELFEKYLENSTEGFTPRQIKIIYYRYLLTRSLLLRFYQASNLEFVWQRPFYCDLLIQLLIKYSQSKNWPHLSKHRMEICQSNAQVTKVYFNGTIGVDTIHYKLLLNVLDLVIAY